MRTKAIPERGLAFSKLEALGNDFLLLDGRECKIRLDGPLARRLADRRLGVGCDQILLLETPAHDAHLARVSVWNADGSPAEQCGNGMRAIGWWAHLGGEMETCGVLETPGEPVTVTITGPEQVRAELAIPDFRPESWGFSGDAGGGWPPGDCGPARAVHALALGNPHVVVEWSEAPSGEELMRYGPAFADHPALTRGANVGLAHVARSDRIVLRVLERGAGPTPACGSGACAAACALIRAGRVNETVRVEQPGGELVIHWPGDGSPVTMTGPARRVFDGTMPWPIAPS